MAKNASGAAFLRAKKKAEERMQARESGLEVDPQEGDVFEMQHHHLLSCLEKTTVSTLTRNHFGIFESYFLFIDFINQHHHLLSCLKKVCTLTRDHYILSPFYHFNIIS